MIDIDKMTSNEWINYRYDLIDAHLAKGLPLEPSPNCKQCDVANDYLCFDCECRQIDEHKTDCPAIDGFGCRCNEIKKEEEMKQETNGWGDSAVATKYIYQRIHGILDLEDGDDITYHLSRFIEELALNYKVDTNRLIGEDT